MGVGFDGRGIQSRIQKNEYSTEKLQEQSIVSIFSGGILLFKACIPIFDLQFLISVITKRLFATRTVTVDVAKF